MCDCEKLSLAKVPDIRRCFVQSIRKLNFLDELKTLMAATCMNVFLFPLETRKTLILNMAKGK